MHFFFRRSNISLVVETRQQSRIENALLAQLVEHLTLNQVVQGSRPWQRTPSTVFVGISYGDGTFFARKLSHARDSRKTRWKLAYIRVFSRCHAYGAAATTRNKRSGFESVGMAFSPQPQQQKQAKQFRVCRHGHSPFILSSVPSRYREATSFSPYNPESPSPLLPKTPSNDSYVSYGTAHAPPHNPLSLPALS